MDTTKEAPKDTKRHDDTETATEKHEGKEEAIKNHPTKKALLAIAAVLLALLFAGNASAQVNATPVQVALSATLAESLSVTASTPSLTATVTGMNATFPTLTITTTYNVNVGRIIDTYAYFASETALQGNGAAVNNTSQLTANINGTSGLYTSTVVGVPYAYSLFHFTTTTSVYQGSNAATVVFTIPNFAAWPAGVYQGTLNVASQAI